MTEQDQRIALIERQRMTRILILGAAPLPFEPQRRQYAANLRTWHFTQPLVADRHQVRLVAGRLPNTYGDDVEQVVHSQRDGLDYFSVAAELFHDDVYLQELCDAFEPDAILGVNTYPASRAVNLRTEVPIWCDLNGWVMAEAQTKCHVYNDNRYLSHFWKMESVILDRADVISTVSRAQALATFGELAARGRLGRKTFGYDFVHAIPNAVSDVEYHHTRRVIRGVLVPDGAFVVLWAGGYNTWTDVDLLHDALSAAMREVPNLHFVSTGGTIEGHDEITFERFTERARNGRFEDRFHFVGWVPTQDVPNYYLESDLGINVDSWNCETLFGARNRLNDMMKSGLAVLTTIGTEISEIIAEHGLGLTCRIGDAAGFAERMVWAATHRDEVRQMADTARNYVRKEFSYARTTEPLRSWADVPQRAPDHGQRVRFENVDFFRPPEYGTSTPAVAAALRQAREEAAALERRYHRVRKELGEIHQSKMWRLWMTYVALRRWLLWPFRRDSSTH